MDESITQRIEQIKRKIAARTGPDGKPRPGFKENIKACEAEIARLEAALADKEAAGGEEN